MLYVGVFRCGTLLPVFLVHTTGSLASPSLQGKYAKTKERSPANTLAFRVTLLLQAYKAFAQKAVDSPGWCMAGAVDIFFLPHLMSLFFNYLAATKRKGTL